MRNIQVNRKSKLRDTKIQALFACLESQLFSLSTYLCSYLRARAIAAGVLKLYFLANFRTSNNDALLRRRHMAPSLTSRIGSNTA